eukprot:3537481-Prymnesium_polylepis.2
MPSFQMLLAEADVRLAALENRPARCWRMTRGIRKALPAEALALARRSSAPAAVVRNASAFGDMAVKHLARSGSSSFRLPGGDQLAG